MKKKKEEERSGDERRGIAEEGQGKAMRTEKRREKNGRTKLG